MTHLLVDMEPRLRRLLPADLYVAVWMDPSPVALTRVFEHLRTMLGIMHSHVPRQVVENPPTLGEIQFEWQQGTLMFTDLAGFTPLAEANAAQGRDGARALLEVLNAYFSDMIEIVSKAGGNLLEFTGDALLVQFPVGRRQNHTARAVRAGLRMQRAMARFEHIETLYGTFSLGMRVGIHTGRFLTADIGTPRRMEHVLLGKAVHLTKVAEGAGVVRRVCLTRAAYERVRGQFRFEPGESDHRLVVDDLTDDQLGEYDLLLPRRRPSTPLLLDRSTEGVMSAIEDALDLLEPLSSFLPSQILNLLIESATRRQVPPDFLEPTVIFVNVVGLAETVEQASAGEQANLVNDFSHLFALINAAIEARGGVLKKVTYHLVGSDIMIYFGPPTAHTDDPVRAASAALAIRDIIAGFVPSTVGGAALQLKCKIGLSHGAAFAAEIGEPRGRHEFNVLSDTVNIAARLMSRAADNQILLTERVYHKIASHFCCESLGEVSLKGKSTVVSLYSLQAGL